MIQFEELKLSLEALHPDIAELANALGLERLRMEIEQLEQRASQPGFWDDAQNSQKILQRTGSLKNKVSAYEGLVSAYEDALALIEEGQHLLLGHVLHTGEHQRRVVAKRAAEIAPGREQRAGDLAREIEQREFLDAGKFHFI